MPPVEFFMRRLLATSKVAVSLVLLVSAGACAVTASEPAEVRRADRPFAVFDFDEGGVSREALLSGVLELTDGCLTVKTETGESYNLVLSDTTVWQDGALQWGDEWLEPGDPISLGGGEFSSASALSEHGLPAACVTGAPAWKTQ